MSTRPVPFTIFLAVLLLGGAGCDEVARGTRARLKVTPSELVFRGALPRLQAYEHAVRLENVGSAPLDVGPFSIDGDPQLSLAPDTPASRTLGPGAFLDLGVRYTAIDHISRNGTVRISATDPDSPRVSVPVRSEASAPGFVLTDCLRADGGDAPCEGSTDDLLVDFGDVRPGLCRDADVIVENTGIAELIVEPPVFQAGSSSAFALARGAADGGLGGLLLAPVAEDGVTAKQTVVVRYCPVTPGGAEATLLLASNDPERPQASVRFVGVARAPHCTVTQQLVQPVTAKADVLFVIDNSGSMSDNQANLRANFNALADHMNRQSVDYQIGVITTDNAGLVGTPRVIYVGDDDPVAEFNRNANVGITGSGAERGLEFAKKALTEPLLSTSNAGFMRADAGLEIIIVSDEEDQSSGTTASFAAFFLGLKDPTRGNPVHVNAIAGNVPGGCRGSTGTADAAARYKAVVDATSGVFGSICDASFAGVLTNIGMQLGPQREIRLQHRPDPVFPIAARSYPNEPACNADTTFTGGTPLRENAADGFTYEATTNSVVFNVLPPRGSCVRVQYETNACTPAP